MKDSKSVVTKRKSGVDEIRGLSDREDKENNATKEVR